MQIHTTVRHFELDPEDRRYALERLGRFERFTRDATEVHLVVTAEGSYRHSAEIVLRLKGQELLSREEATEARNAIVLAADRLEEQLRRLKERRVDRRRRAGNSHELPAEGTADHEDATKEED